MNLITEIYCDSSHTGWGVYIPCCNLRAKGKYLNKVTTNEGEFLAMREALHESSAYCGESALIIIYSDSQLVVKCLTGGWHVKPQHLRILHQECHSNKPVSIISTILL